MGFEVIACNVDAVYHNTDQASCAVETGGTPGKWMVNGNPVTTTDPIPVNVGSMVDIVTNNWMPSTLVPVWFHSNPVQLGEFTVDGAGEAAGTVTIPDDANAGVHRIVLRGVTPAGQDRTVTFYVEVAGEPEPGMLYGVMVDGLEPFETATVTYLGSDIGYVQADQDGNAYLEIVIADFAVVGDTPIQITGTTSGTLTIPVSATITCDGLEPTIFGTPSDDTIEGTRGDDIIVGLGGDDTIAGGGGNDTICGNSGDDTINGQSGVNTVDGGLGDDRILAKKRDTIIPGPGDDTIN